MYKAIKISGTPANVKAIREAITSNWITDEWLDRLIKDNVGKYLVSHPAASDNFDGIERYQYLSKVFVNLDDVDDTKFIEVRQ